jgi:hypothetical protein
VCWKNYFSKPLIFVCSALFTSVPILAQQSQPDALTRVMNRLDELERQNQTLLNEMQELKAQLKTMQSAAAPQNPKLEERVDVAEQQIKDQAQSKVESSQKYPISLNGMLLFDAFLDTGQSYNGGYGYMRPTARAGATLAQSILGLELSGPQLPGDGRVHGSLSMDFYGQTDGSYAFRIRQGSVSFDWKRRSFTVGQEKSLIAPLQPTSYARVGIPPLDGAGNLWLWRPQARYEERIPFSTNTQAAVQLGVLQTSETYSTPTLPTNARFEASRPAIQGRLELRHQWQEESRLTAGIGFHSSSTHVLGQSIPSRVISADLLFKPIPMLEISGTIFRGQNFSNIGGGPPGFSVSRQGVAIPIHGAGGWLQVALPVTSRLTFDLYAGRQVNEARDLTPYQVSRTLTYAGNILYRISPNVVLGFEGSQQRVSRLNYGQMLGNRYDATVAYLF